MYIIIHAFPSSVFLIGPRLVHSSFLLQFDWLVLVSCRDLLNCELGFTHSNFLSCQNPLSQWTLSTFLNIIITVTMSCSQMLMSLMVALSMLVMCSLQTGMLQSMMALKNTSIIPGLGCFACRCGVVSHSTFIYFSLPFHTVNQVKSLLILCLFAGIHVVSSPTAQRPSARCVISMCLFARRIARDNVKLLQ